LLIEFDSVDLFLVEEQEKGVDCEEALGWISAAKEVDTDCLVVILIVYFRTHIFVLALAIEG